MRKVIALVAISILLISTAAGFSIIQPLNDGVSEIAAQLLGGDQESDFVKKDNPQLQGDLNMGGNNLTNFFGSGCTTGEAAYDVWDNGTLKCQSVGEGSTGSLSSVLSGGNDAGDNDINMSGNNITGVQRIDPSGTFTTGGDLEQVPTGSVVAGSVTDVDRMSNPREVSVADKYAYVISMVNDSLTVIDIHEPSNPTIVGHLSDGTNLDGPRALEVRGDYAYAALSGGNGLAAVDLSDPSQPQVTDTITGFGFDNPADVAVSGQYAYVVSQRNEQAIVDISNPDSLTMPDSLEDFSYNWGYTEVRGNYQYMMAANGATDGFVINDVTEPNAWNYVATRDWVAGPISLSGGYAYLGQTSNDAVSVVNISDVTNPQIVGTVTDSSALDNPQGLEVSGDYGYVVGQDGDQLSILDVSRPSDPRVIVTFDSSTYLSGVEDLAISGHHVYAVSDRLTIIDVTGMSGPTAQIGGLQVGDLHVTDDATIGQNLKVGSGLNVGSHGIKTDGELVVNGDIEATGSKNFVQQVNSTHSVVYTSSESSEAVVEWTDTVDVSEGSNMVEFPLHYRAVLSGVEDYHVFTQPRDFVDLEIVEKEADGFTLEASDSAEVDVHVRGVRGGFEDEEVWR